MKQPKHLNDKQQEKEQVTQPIQCALISVSDKTNLELLATILKDFNITTLSTGGTAKTLQGMDVNVKEVSDYTGSPEIMNGRVKTLHPKIHGGLLADLSNDEHVTAMQDHAIESIDLVVVNLYPFEETVAKGAAFSEAIENIDIGGPSMIRSAAKNHAYTVVITDTADYAVLAEELKANNGSVSDDFRRQMAAKAFARTAAYDSAISQWFAKEQSESFPEELSLSFSKKQSLRYGENPHQEAAFYVVPGLAGVGQAKQIQGKELSYNNINDANAALSLVQEFEQPAAVIIKHANPCGVAVGQSIEEAYKKALASDPVSAFGGIIALNRPVTEALAGELSTMFVEAILAPEIDKKATEILAKKKNMRLLLLEDIAQRQISYQYKSVQGGLLVQSSDDGVITENDLKVVTKIKPTDEQIASLLFANTLCKHVASNAIVLVKDQASIGVGAGQMSRVDSVKIAINKANESQDAPNRIQDSILASDAFFPFADGLELAAKAGVKAIIQPGGSIRDEEVIAMADEHGVAMVLTGMRHFKH